MQVEIIITDDDGDVTTKKVNLSQWKAAPLKLGLLSAVVDRPLAETYFACATAGIDMLMQVYTRTCLERRTAELCTFIEGG